MWAFASSTVWVEGLLTKGRDDLATKWSLKTEGAWVYHAPLCFVPSAMNLLDHCVPLAAIDYAAQVMENERFLPIEAETE